MLAVMLVPIYEPPPLLPSSPCIKRRGTENKKDKGGAEDDGSTEIYCIVLYNTSRRADTLVAWAASTTWVAGDGAAL